MLEERAKQLAITGHKSQVRKDNITPYITHPEAVVSLLKQIRIADEDILCAAWLHDTIEDCGYTHEFIEKEINLNVARIVSTLTRDVDRETYKNRIKNSDYAVQIVKLADVIHNSSTLDNTLPEKTISRLVKDSQDVYLELAQKICPEFAVKLNNNIKPYLS